MQRNRPDRRRPDPLPRATLDVHALTLHGRGPVEDHDQFAVADIAKSLRLHASSLSLDDETRVHGDSQGHVFLLVDRLTDSRLRPRSSDALDGLVDYFVNDLPWTRLTRGDTADVTAALEEAVRDCRAKLDSLGSGAQEPALTLAYVDWPELHVVRLGAGTCKLVRGTRAVEVAATSAADAPSVEHRHLEHGDVLVVLNGHLARSTDVLGECLRCGATADAEELCSELVRGPRDDDRTAIVARFLPFAARGAIDRPTPPRRLHSHATARPRARGRAS